MASCQLCLAEAARQVLVMGTSNGPPYMDSATDSGLDIDIPRAVLERMGYQVEVRYMSLARAQAQLRAKKIDYTAPLFIGDKPGIHSSDPHVYYRPTAFSLQENQLQVSSLSDLGKYTMITFQGAGGYFGDVFIEASQRSPRYSEIHDMTLLPKMLYAKRSELVVLDYYIFHYQLSEMGGVDWKATLAVHDVFPRVPAVVGFHDPGLRDAFNRELKAFHKDGVYQAILDRYAPQ